MSGVVAPDGSPVDVYRALPRPAEADAIHAALPAGASVLDLGAGTGRFARALAALGHPVVAVDHEPAMLDGLASVEDIEPIVADIIGLSLGRRFDAVLLASHLVDDDDLGPAALAVAHQHVTPDGLVIVETYPPGLDWPAAVGRRSQLGPVGITITRARVDGDQLDAEVRYDLDGRTWDQPFTPRLLDDTTLDARLGDAGLRRERWLDRERGWLVARPA
ncbi:MAG: class I SAM-dependent methyltransferase [Chloroflexota bacterium]